jgi:hypothetical protein
MKWYNQILIALLLISVCILSGCTEEVYLCNTCGKPNLTDVTVYNCTSRTTGVTGYNYETNDYYYCNTTTWVKLNNQSGGSGTTIFNYTYYINTTNNLTNNITNNITNTVLPPYLRGINNSTYSADVLEEENYFNSPFFGYGCYENWLLQSEQFGTTWIKVNGTAIANDNAISPIGTLIAENSIGNTSLNRTQIYQTVTSNSRNNVTFSIWLRTYLNNVTNATVHLQLHSNNDSFYPQPIIDVNITGYWNRYNITTNFNFNHTIKNITIFQDEVNISLWGAQLENGTRPTINGIARTTTGNLVQTCGLVSRTAPIFTGSVTSAGISSSASCGCTGVATGGALSGATTGAFSSTTTFGGTMTQTVASTLNLISLYGLVLGTATTSTAPIPVQGSTLLSFRSNQWNGTTATTPEYNFALTGDNTTKTTSFILFNRKPIYANLIQNITILNITSSIFPTSNETNITFGNRTTLRVYAIDNSSQLMCLQVYQSGVVNATRC